MSLRVYNDEPGSSFQLTGNAQLRIAYPYTISAWGYTWNAARANDTLFCSGGNASTTNGVRLMFSSNAVVLRVGGAANNAVSSAILQSQKWHHACGVGASATSRTAYADGDFSGSNVVNFTPVTAAACAIGGAGATDAGFSGLIAEIAMWDTVLTTSQISALSKGECPLFVQQANLIFYAPLRADTRSVHNPTMYSRVSGLTFIPSGTDATHPYPQLNPEHPDVFDIESNVKTFMPSLMKFDRSLFMPFFMPGD